MPGDNSSNNPNVKISPFSSIIDAYKSSLEPITPTNLKLNTLSFLLSSSELAISSTPPEPPKEPSPTKGSFNGSGSSLPAAF